MIRGFIMSPVEPIPSGDSCWPVVCVCSRDSRALHHHDHGVAAAALLPSRDLTGDPTPGPVDIGQFKRLSTASDSLTSTALTPNEPHTKYWDDIFISRAELSSRDMKIA